MLQVLGVRGSSRIAAVVALLVGLGGVSAHAAAPRAEARSANRLVERASTVARKAGQATAPVRHARQRASYNFDWDDNAVTMITRLHLVSRTGKADLPVSTAEFAMIKHQLGKPGPYEDYQIGALDHTFRETRAPGFFAQQLAESMRAAPSRWQGPSWDRFVEAMSHEHTAQETSIITARSSDPREIYQGLRALRKAGLIKHLPTLANIYSVENPAAHFDGTPLVGPTAEKKATVMLGLLARLDKRRMPRDAATLRAPDGNGFRAQHTWGFSDDDWDNYEAARRVLSEHAHEFPNVKIKVRYTGTNNPKHQPETMIVHAGGHRPELPEEKNEGARVRRIDQTLERFRQLR